MKSRRRRRDQWQYETPDSPEKLSLPFVVGVMADLAGESEETEKALEDRSFRDFDVDNFELRMEAMKPRVSFTVPDVLTGEGEIPVDLQFEGMDDFSPAAVAGKVEPLEDILQVREQLDDLRDRVAGRAEAEQALAELIRDSRMLRRMASAGAEGPEEATPPSSKSSPESQTTEKPPSSDSRDEGEAGDTQWLRDQFDEPLDLTTDRGTEEAQEVARTLAERAVSREDLVSQDVGQSMADLRAELERSLTRQLNHILHNPAFQRMEGAWRGLHHLVHNSMTGTDVKIRVLPVSKGELREEFDKYQGSADRSEIFQKLCREEFDVPGGEPYRCLIGDYYFDHSPADLSVLRGMGRLAAAAQAPFIAGSSPALFQLDSWGGLNDGADLMEVFEGPEYDSWSSFRESEDSRYVALTLPRFLSRLPYGAETEPVEEFDFEEDTAAGDDSKYTWANAAYAMGTNLTRSYNRHDWCVAISGRKSGGEVEALPCHVFPTADGGQDMKGPTEIPITRRRMKELSDLGFLPLCHIKNTDSAVFFDARTVHEPQEYEDRHATVREELGTRLPLIMISSRYMHYLRRLAGDRVGSFTGPGQLERYLNRWLMNYVLEDPESAAPEVRARYPLRRAKVEISEDEGAGCCMAELHISFHYPVNLPPDVSLVVTARISCAGKRG